VPLQGRHRSSDGRQQRPTRYVQGTAVDRRVFETALSERERLVHIDRYRCLWRLEIFVQNHFLSATDGALLRAIVMQTLHMLGIVVIEGRRQLAVASYCLRSFFDACLKGGSVSRSRAHLLFTPSTRLDLKRPLATTVLGSQKTASRCGSKWIN